MLRCCDQASIYHFDFLVSRSTAFSRQPPCAGHLRRLGPSLLCLFWPLPCLFWSLPCLFYNSLSQRRDPKLRSFCWILRQGDKKVIPSRQQGSIKTLKPRFASTFGSLGDNVFRAAVSACRLASMFLPSLGLAVATAFLLSTTSLGRSPLASSTPSAFPR